MDNDKIVEVGGKVFYISKIPALKALRLDHRLIKLISPALKMLATVTKSESGKIGFQVNADIAEVIADSFSDIVGKGGDEAIALVLDLLEYAVYMPAGNPSVQVKGNEDAIFDGSPADIYMLAYEVARINKFTPFALTSDGNPSTTDG